MKTKPVIFGGRRVGTLYQLPWHRENLFEARPDNLWSVLAARYGLPRPIVKGACYMFACQGGISLEEALARCAARYPEHKLEAMLRDFASRVRKLPPDAVKNEKNGPLT